MLVAVQRFATAAAAGFNAQMNLPPLRVLFFEGLAVGMTVFDFLLGSARARTSLQVTDVRSKSDANLSVS